MGLRETLIFRKHAWVYYVAIVLDVLLRLNRIPYCVWTTDAQHGKCPIHNTAPIEANLVQSRHPSSNRRSDHSRVFRSHSSWNMDHLSSRERTSCEHRAPQSSQRHATAIHIRFLHGHPQACEDARQDVCQPRLEVRRQTIFILNARNDRCYWYDVTSD